MSYAIKNIAELETLDFTNLHGSKETVRKSIDGTKFIIEGDNITEYTHEEISLICQTSEWNNPF